jgi:mRNA interferase RelE/StbE
MYHITFTRSARKELEMLSTALQLRILEKIEQLQHNPAPHGCKKIKGSMQSFRIRIGDYRVIYEVDSRKKNIDVAVVRHRQSAYT